MFAQIIFCVRGIIHFDLRSDVMYFKIINIMHHFHVHIHIGIHAVMHFLFMFYKGGQKQHIWA